MGQLSIPKAPNVATISMSRFVGADLTNEPSYISTRRSPDCPNMIRESVGKVRKWIGWHTTKEYDGQINGFHIFSDETGDTLLVHRGTKLYNGNTVLYTGMANARSSSRQLNKKLIIADGKKLLMYYKNGDNFTVDAVENHAYCPTVVISRSPTGGGTTYEAINLLGNKRTDSFLGVASVTTYQLSATNITSVDKVEILDSNGNYVETTAYTTDLVTGRVIFTSAPGVSPVTGQDNIHITFSKTVDGYADRINKCDIMTLYGVGGAMDRIFLSGDDNYPNRDYYCQMDDPTYWGDLQYSVIGQDNSKIIGYSIINDTLATHINRSDNDTNIMLRNGKLLDDGTASFSLSGAYQGTGAISKWSFANLETEPLFLTEFGVYAVTPSDVIGERYAQLRSYYLNGLLLKQNLRNAVATTYDRFYMLAVGGYLFALDGTQAHSEENEPYSKRQYEGFYRTNVNARVIANINNKLIFGTPDGKICEFYTDWENPSSYNDDGAAINAKWTTPDLASASYSSRSAIPFYYKKRFKRMAVMIGSYTTTSIQVKAKYDGQTETVIEYDNSARYFSFQHIVFSKFTFKTDETAYIIREKISIKPDNKKAQFIYENGVLNEPFSLYQSTIEITGSR